MTDAFLELPHARLHYEVAGEGTRLVLIHQSWGTMHAWDPQWEELTLAHRVLRYDLRFSGRSSGILRRRVYHADDVLALMDAVGFQSAILIGAGFGLDVALDFALTYPCRTRGLVLVGPGFWGQTRLEGLRTTVRGICTEVRNRRMRSGYDRLDFDARAEAASRSPQSGTTAEFPHAQTLVRGMIREGNSTANRGLHWYDFHTGFPLTKLDGVLIPTLVIICGAAFGTNIESTLAVAKRLPYGQTLIAERNTQWMNLEEPERFNTIVLDWLATIEKARE